jgi:hypothetical protein
MRKAVSTFAAATVILTLTDSAMVEATHCKDVETANKTPKAGAPLNPERVLDMKALSDSMARWAAITEMNDDQFETGIMATLPVIARREHLTAPPVTKRPTRPMEEPATDRVGASLTYGTETITRPRPPRSENVVIR